MIIHKLNNGYTQAIVFKIDGVEIKIPGKLKYIEDTTLLDKEIFETELQKFDLSRIKLNYKIINLIVN